MLPEHLQELLTAEVDGELNAAERRLVDKLLRDSEEARVFHGQLAHNAERLQQLPKAVPADDLANNILNIIAEKSMRPTPLPMPRRKPVTGVQRFLPWVSIAVAATVVIGVGLMSYVYFSVAQQQRSLVNGEIDAGKNQKSKTPPVVVNSGNQHVVAKMPVAEVEVIKVEVGPPPREAPVVVKNVPPVRETPVVSPKVKDETLQGNPPIPDSEPFKQVNGDDLPLIVPLKDLDPAAPKESLRSELKKDEVVRLDLFVKDSTRAAELMQNALKARGNHILVDAIAQDRLKKKQRSEYAFYTESLTADEIAQLLEHLGADDKKAETKKAGDGQFNKFVLTRLAPYDLDQLSKLLGISAAELKLPKPRTVGLDPRKPLESSTVMQLANNLPKGGAAPQRTTLVLPYPPVHGNPQTSKEIKAFLAGRGERKAGAVPIMLLLRVSN